MYKQILLVEDDIYLAYAIQSYISSKNKKIFIVNDSRIALKLLKIYAFDLVISDIMMPYLNGYQLLSKLRANTQYSSIPFIFLTAKGMTHDRIEGYNLGCNAYLTKPFHPSELLSIINNLLDRLDTSTHYKQNKQSKHNMKLLNHTTFNFTSREKSITHLLVKGLMNSEIANILNISKRNVEKYISRLLNKTKTRNRTELIRILLSVKGE